MHYLALRLPSNERLRLRPGMATGVNRQKRTVQNFAGSSASTRNGKPIRTEEKFEDLEVNVVVVPGFQERLAHEKTKMPGKMAVDEPIADAMKR